ncbi:hypothetical protein F4821DRAFT_214190 [Hypoxylon rubiginosum]|uniref:Uncharacterized protein n=1 Tax=Hypoxylon rubiginosum TaxID=110542 RepID=A0ACC0CPS0_9PEZI|nr:hypothetical protein F4821DRAFT_214190 [Hypoxylon rubiginosum]
MATSPATSPATSTDVFDFLPQEGFDWWPDGKRLINKKQGLAIGKVMAEAYNVPLSKSLVETMIAELFVVGMQHIKLCSSMQAEDFWGLIRSKVTWAKALTVSETYGFLRHVIAARCMALSSDDWQSEEFMSHPSPIDADHRSATVLQFAMNAFVYQFETHTKKFQDASNFESPEVANEVQERLVDYTWVETYFTPFPDHEGYDCD